MLTADQFDALTGPILDLYEEYMQSVLNDIARRLASADMTATAAWQMQRLTESGAVYEYALAQLEKLTGRSEAVLRATFERAGVKTMRFDDAIYRKAGLNPLPLNLSPAMLEVLRTGLARTNAIVRNLTMTTALEAQNAFIEAADLAYMQVVHGAMDYNSAIRQAVKDVAANGLPVIRYANGHADQLDVAMRRTVLTGIGQTTGELQIARADEMGVDLVQTSAHAGARNTGTGPANHEGWQGKVFSRSGQHPHYPDFIVSTGYGTGEGLMGINCVLGNTLVSGPAVRAAYRREYSGEVIVLRTSSGKELTVTPNHPILTDKGWVAAGLLAEGDNVISRARFNYPPNTCPDPYQNEPRIENVFDSLTQSRDMLRLPVSACHFHGDVSDGEVNAVFPDGFLRNWIYAAFFEHKIETPFGLTPKSTGSFSTDSGIDEVFFSPDHPSYGVVGGFGDGGASFCPSSLHPDPHGVRPTISQRNAEFDEIFTNQSFRDSDLSSDFILPETRVVQGEKLIGADTGFTSEVHSPVVGLRYAIPFETILDGMKRTSVFIGNKLIGLPRHIELDNIVLVERKQLTSTHVYNLETEDGWYCANGIITHNCRHSFYPFFEGISENVYNQATYAGKTVTYNGQEMSVYEATQQQRAIERKIRYWKREAGALQAAGLDNSAELARVKALQGRMRGFTQQTGLARQYERERVYV